MIGPRWAHRRPTAIRGGQSTRSGLGPVTVAILLSNPGSALAQPELSIMAPAVAGGGWDSTARGMQQALVKSGIAKSVHVTNVPGSGGSVGLVRFVNEAKGDGSRLMISGFAMVGSIILNRTPVTLDRITPIARLTADTQAIAVPARRRSGTRRISRPRSRSTPQE